MFQITVGVSHSINLAGMKHIHDNLPANARHEAVLIFILPQGHDYTSEQTYVRSGSLNTIDDAWPGGTVFQYVLSLNDDELYENK